MQTFSLSSSVLTAPEIVSIGKISLTNNPTLSSVSFPALLDVIHVEVFSNPVLVDISLPALKAHVGATNQNLTIASNLALTTANFNSLQSSTQAVVLNDSPLLVTLQLDRLVFVNSFFSITGDSALSTLSLPALVTVCNFPLLGFLASNCTSLANVSFPKYLPTKGRLQSFDNCALTEASVDHILARCVASANYTSGTVNLSGGTNAVPGVQGQLDKATLIARGCTVLTN